MPKTQRKIFNVAIKKPAVNNAVDNELELYFLDLIYNVAEFDWWTGTMTEGNIVEDVISQVKSANPSKIKCYIDSQGGDANIGIAIYNFLKNYNAKVEVEVIGMAGSIASVLAMAANKGKLNMARNAFMVIHRAWGAGVGNSDDLRQQADVLDKYTDQICDIYAQRTGKTVDEIKGLIANGDYWMTGTEAKDLGFCDNLLNDNAQFQVAARVKTLDPNYKNIPQNLLGEETQPSILNLLKEEVMNVKTLVSNFINGLKGTKPADPAPAPAPANNAPKPEDKPEGEGKPEVNNDVNAFATSIEKPLTEFLTEVQNEIKTEVANAVKETTVYKDLEKKVNDLITENKELKAQIEKLNGGEGKETTPSNSVNKRPSLRASN